MKKQGIKENKAYSLKTHIKQELEKIISKLPAVIEETEDIKVANVTLVFDNEELLQLLKKRGDAYSNNKHEKVEKYKILIRPIEAYVSFEKQEGYERAMKFDDRPPICCSGRNSKRPKLLGSRLYFRSAPEPTNIIWEHSNIQPTS